MYKNYLAHYGVKGMKWGVRKEEYLQRKQDSKNRREIRKRYNQYVKSLRDNKTLGRSRFPNTYKTCTEEAIRLTKHSTHPNIDREKLNHKLRTATLIDIGYNKQEANQIAKRYASSIPLNSITVFWNEYDKQVKLRETENMIRNIESGKMSFDSMPDWAQKRVIDYHKKNN